LKQLLWVRIFAKNLKRLGSKVEPNLECTLCRTSASQKHTTSVSNSQSGVPDIRDLLGDAPAERHGDLLTLLISSGGNNTPDSITAAGIAPRPSLLNHRHRG